MPWFILTILLLISDTCGGFLVFSSCYPTSCFSAIYQKLGSGMFNMGSATDPCYAFVGVESEQLLNWKD